MTYRGYRIDIEVISTSEYFVVNFEGDDVVFDTVSDAMLFIDEIHNMY